MKINFLSKLFVAFSLFFLLTLPESCTISTGNGLTSLEDRGGILNSIIERGELVVLTDDNPFNYFLLNGQANGFQYEMAKKFADHLGVKLTIVVESDLHKAVQALKHRRVDMLAMELPRVTGNKDPINFSDPLFITRQVLVQRKNHRKKDTAPLISELAQLSGKTLILPNGKYKQFDLTELLHATHNQLDIVGVNKVTSPDLVKQVAAGKIDYTIAWEHHAKALANIYTNIEIGTPVTPEMGSGWMVRKDADQLLEEINQWIADNNQSRSFKYTASKYFTNPRWARLAMGQPVNRKSISAYDDMIRQASKNIDWDWRLLAALIYRESKFNPEAISRVGAFGLMQLMPNTANRFGASPESTPAEQIAAGTRLIKTLDRQLKPRVPNPDERIKFVLAAYNIGLAHIYDALNLTEKYDKDPAVWEGNVEYYLLAKSEPKFYNDPVVKYGKVRGTETQRFVADVMESYQHFKPDIPF
jgi:membrane-bound lytic murein transglycosylase F